MKTYGTLEWARATRTARNGRWQLRVAPHVAIKAKRVFPRIEQSRTSVIELADTAEIASDLVWFFSRYPVEMDAKVQARLEARAAEHTAYVTSIENILDGRTVQTGSRVPARQPRDYQQVAADLANLTGGLLLADDVGLGKTNSALLMLQDPTTLPALVVVPTHLPNQWMRELNAIWPDLKGHIITSSTPIVRRKRKTGVVEEAYDTEGADVLIMSYSKLAGWRDALAGQVRTVIFDEVQELRHEGSQKYDAAAAIADLAARKIGLSATPIYNWGGEAFAIYEVLKPGVLGSRYEFFREWGGATRPNGQVVVADPAALGNYLRDQGLLLKRTRHDVGRELPKPIEIVQEIESGTTQTDSVMDDMVALAQRVLHSADHRERFRASGDLDYRLRQATGMDKAPHVATFVRMLLESESKIVLFGWHRQVYETWLTALADFNPVMYTGSETAKAKDASVQRFREDPDCRVFICSLRSGAGLDGLQDVSSVAVFGELDWSPAMHHQCIGRLAREGQENEVVAYYLMSMIGSDPIVAGVLEAKWQQSEPFVNGNDATLFNVTPDDGGGRIKKLAQDVLTRAERAA